MPWLSQSSHAAGSNAGSTAEFVDSGISASHRIAVIAPSQIREAANQSCIQVLHMQDKQHQHANTQALPKASTQGKLEFHISL